MQCSCRPAGVWASRSARNSTKFSVRVESVTQAATSPSWTLSPAKSTAVPWRRYSNSRRTAIPGTAGLVGFAGLRPACRTSQRCVNPVCTGGCRDVHKRPVFSASCLFSGIVQHRLLLSGQAPTRFGSRRSRVRIPPPRPIWTSSLHTSARPPRMARAAPWMGRSRRGRQRYGGPMTESMARRLFELVEPIALVTYMADEPTEAVMALGLRNMWDAYFAGRAAALGRERAGCGGPRFFLQLRRRRGRPSHPCGRRSPPRSPMQRGGTWLCRRTPADPRRPSPMPPASSVPATSPSRRGPAPRTEGRALLRRRAHAAGARPNRWRGCGTAANLLREHRGDGHVAALC